MNIEEVRKYCLSLPDTEEAMPYGEDLEHCGFIVRTNAYGARKYNAIYRLMDNFSLFYLKFMQENKTDDPSFWSHNYTSSLRYSWCGLAFERVCFQHIPQIKQALGISGVVTNTYSWQVKDDPVYGAGAQIDMLIERADNTINICKMNRLAMRNGSTKARELVTKNSIVVLIYHKLILRELHLTDIDRIIGSLYQHINLRSCAINRIIFHLPGIRIGNNA